jgi:transposase
MEKLITYIGLDVHKNTIAVAVTESGPRKEVRDYGMITNTPAALKKLIAKLAGNGHELRFCYEAGPCGYSIQRQITAAGHECIVVAPSLIPKKPGDRVKTDRRDAINLAKLHRAGELTAVWVPDEAHEAIRDLVRARLAAATLVAELGDITRFTKPTQLMAYLGLVPSESSRGSKRRQGGITKTGNEAARRMLIEAAWSYRFPARIGRAQLIRQEKLAKPVRDIAWKAQERLCRRYRKFALAGKLTTVITTAIARELTGFVWAIANQVQPAAA